MSDWRMASRSQMVSQAKNSILLFPASETAKADIQHRFRSTDVRYYLSRAHKRMPEQTLSLCDCSQRLSPAAQMDRVRCSGGFRVTDSDLVPVVFCQ